MDFEQEFERVLRKEKAEEMIHFLRTLTEAERKALVPHIKKTGKELLTYGWQGNTYSSRATQDQVIALGYAWFICYNKKEFEKENPAWLIAREHLDKILTWYIPSWLNDYVNSFVSRSWLPPAFNYWYMMELKGRGLIQPPPQLVARLLTTIIYENDKGFRFTPEKLLIHKETLEEHIWYLFEFETTVHAVTRYINFQDTKEQTGWITVFKKYADEGKIDRLRLMKEALLGSNRNFNKNLSGWFADLFLALEPKQEEIVAIQNELLVLFSSPHSKVVNVALQNFKQIAEHPSFAVDELLDAIPMAITSETKSMVTSCLQILEKLAKKHEAKRRQILELVMPVFIQKDESLQTKAAKLIQKYGNEELSGMLSSYSQTLLSSAKEILKDFFIEKKEEELPVIPVVHALNDETKLPSIHSFDDLVFLCSQAFDNHESWHIDAVPAALLQWNHALNASNISKLEPALQRALKLYHGDWRSTNGHLDRLLASFFIDYCFWIIRKFGNEAGSLKNHCEVYFNKIERLKEQWQKHGANVTYLRGWRANSETDWYVTHKRFLVYAIECIKSGHKHPFLSTPTHTPGWIHPTTLVQRIVAYDKVTPDPIDVQMAFSRCWLHETGEAIALAKQKLSGASLEVLLYLLDAAAEPASKQEPEWIWNIAAMSKSPSPNYPWRVEVENYFEDKYRWENGRYKVEKIPAQRKKLHIQFTTTPAEPEKTGLKKWLSKLMPSKPVVAEQGVPLIYDHLQPKTNYISVEDRDIRRLILLIPNNPEPLIAQVIHKCFIYAELSEGEKRMVVETLGAIHDIGKPSGETTHLLIAAAMLGADKTGASYAAEIWIRGVQEETINSKLIGSILGKFEHIEFAPLKRFTDLVMDRMLGISPAHNKALEEMMTALLKGLPDVPIKNLKKALEIYIELLNTNRSEIHDKELQRLLKSWKEKEGLKKIIGAKLVE